MAWVGKVCTTGRIHVRPSNPTFRSGKFVGWNNAVYVSDLHYVTFILFILRICLRWNVDYWYECIFIMNSYSEWEKVRFYLIFSYLYDILLTWQRHYFALKSAILWRMRASLNDSSDSASLYCWGIDRIG